MRSQLIFGGYVMGVVIGVLMFFVASALLQSVVNWDMVFRALGKETGFIRGAEYRHAGVVVAHDQANKTITIREKSVFRAPSSPDLRFSYDNHTIWSSREYVFRSGVLEKRTLAGEQERILPAGTLVWVALDPTIAHPWRTTHLAFMKRTDL